MNLKGKRILCTGGRGFLGSHLARTLLERGCQSVDTVASEDHDLRDRDEAMSVVRGLKPDIVIHAAARVGGIGYNVQHPYGVGRDNLVMGLNVIDACAEYKVPKLVLVSSCCFPRGALVAMHDGLYRPIESLVIGDKVKTASGAVSHVSHTFRRWTNESLIGVTPKGGEEILATPEHPFLTSRGWVSASDLTEADILIRPISSQECTDNKVEIISGKERSEFFDYLDCRENGYAGVVSRFPRDSDFSKRRMKAYSWAAGRNTPAYFKNVSSADGDLEDGLAWLCGVFVAEGYAVLAKEKSRNTPPKGYVYFTPGFDMEFSHRIVGEFKKWGRTPRIKVGPTSNVIGLGNKLAYRFFVQCYHNCARRRADTKCIPQFIFNASAKAKADFIRGYWKGDGHVRRRQKEGRAEGSVTMVASSVSRILILQIRDILLSMGICGSIYSRKGRTMQIAGRTVNCRDAWSIRVEGPSAREMLRVLEGGDPQVHTMHRQVPIRRLRRTEPMEQEVFNISVEGEETYQVDGIAVHNCAYPSVPSSMPFEEDSLWESLPEPSNRTYGLAKRMLGTLAAAAVQEKRLPCAATVLLANLYGPGDCYDEDRSHFIPAAIRKFCAAVGAGEEVVKLWGSGRPTRDFLHVRDAAEGIVRVCESWDHSEPINLGTAIPRSIRETAEAIASIVGFTGRIEWANDTLDGQMERALDCTKAWNGLGWEARIDFGAGLRECVQDWRNRQ